MTSRTAFQNDTISRGKYCKMCLWLRGRLGKLETTNEEGGRARNTLGQGGGGRQVVVDAGMEGVRAAASATTDTVIVATVVAIDVSTAAPRLSALSIQSGNTHAIAAGLEQVLS